MLEAMLAARVPPVSERARIAPHVRASDCGMTVALTPQGIEAAIEELLVRRRKMGLPGRR